MTLEVGLTRAMERAGIPITGVSLGRIEDRSTWRCHFRESATALQRAQAAALLVSYELAGDLVIVQERVEAEVARKALLSLARVTWEMLPIGKPTWLEFLARWKAIYLNGVT